MDLFGTKRCVIEKSFAKMRQIAIRVISGRDSLINLRQVKLIPGDILVGQSTEHEPRRFAAADSEHKLAAGRYRVASGCRDDCGSPAGDRVGVGKNFNFHENQRRNGTR